MARFRVYTVHVLPSLPEPYENAVFVNEGFSWRAFLFSGIWALYHRLWTQTALIFAFNLFMLHALRVHDVSRGGFFILHLGVHLFVGFFGNDWRRARLKRLGYVTADVVAGDSLLGAEQRFFDRYFASGARRSLPA